MLTFPQIDPVLFAIGPLEVRWYALAYVVSIVLACLYCDLINRKTLPHEPKLKVFDEFLTWAVIGILLGGRIGYILFYQFDFYINNPVHIVKVWQGGMSFHGGFIGVALAAYFYCKKREISAVRLFDIVAVSAPIGLFFGRIANFINGELWGRVTSSPVGMVFPYGGPLPRHPSQLYEAFLEGFVLFIILWFLAFKTEARKRPFLLSGVFVMGYGVSRFIVEFYREPDAHLGFILGPITMGQLLSTPMIIVGVALITLAYKRGNDES